jgi:serine protease Do
MQKLWLLLGGAVAGLTLALTFDDFRPTAVAQDAAALARQAAGQQEERSVPASRAQIAMSYAPVVKRVSPAVVNIYTARLSRQRVDPFFDLFFGQGRMSRPRVEQSLGSGVILDAEGLVVTNNHVVEGADQILVALADKREFAARLLFADPRTDLAVLRIEARGQRLPVARLGDSDRAEVGDLVLAIGNPFGLGGSVSSGIVSAVARTGIGVSDHQFFLQTDAAINPGNSGGALVAMDGSVIGINTAIFSRTGGSNGVGFAIPANMVRIFLNSARTGTRVAAWLGAEGEPLTPEAAARVGLDRPAGVVLTGVSPNSPAARAGLRQGDVVYAVDGKEVADPGMLRYRIATQPVGDEVTVTLIRDGTARNVGLRLAAPPESPPRDLTTIGGANLLAGVTVGNLSPAFAQEIGAGLPERGVVVVSVDPRAPAAQLDFLKPGDVVDAVNGKRIATVDELERLASASTAMAVRFSRAGRQAECAYRPPNQFACRG